MGGGHEIAAVPVRQPVRQPLEHLPQPEEQQRGAVHHGHHAGDAAGPHGVAEDALDLRRRAEARRRAVLRRSIGTRAQRSSPGVRTLTYTTASRASRPNTTTSRASVSVCRNWRTRCARPRASPLPRLRAARYVLPRGAARRVALDVPHAPPRGGPRRLQPRLQLTLVVRRGQRRVRGRGRERDRDRGRTGAEPGLLRPGPGAARATRPSATACSSSCSRRCSCAFSRLRSDVPGISSVSALYWWRSTPCSSVSRHEASTVWRYSARPCACSRVVRRWQPVSIPELAELGRSRDR